MNTFHNLKSFLLEATKFLSLVISGSYILYIILIRTLFFLIQDSATLNKTFVEMPDLRFGLINTFLFLSIGWMVSFYQRKLKLKNPLKLLRHELILLILSSFIFSYYFLNNFNLLSNSSNLLITSIAILYLTFLTQIVEFYKSYTMEDARKLGSMIKESLRLKHAFDLSKNLLALSFVVLLIAYNMLISLAYVNQKKDFENTFKSSLFITKVSPNTTTYAYTVKLEGYNFGEIPDKKYKLISSYGPVITNTWSSNKIEFVIPLHWKEGGVDLWIEKPNRYNEDKIVLSNIVNIQLLNRWDFFPTENDPLQNRIYKRAIKTLFLDYWNSIFSK